VFVQEHWLLDSQIRSNFFEQNLDDICGAGVSGMLDQNLIVGRPFGGCAILWKRALLASITPISVNNNRICAVTIKFDTINLLAEGKVDVNPLITHRILLADAKEAFDLVAGYEDGVVKAMVVV
jgi:hypothetical protein